MKWLWNLLGYVDTEEDTLKSKLREFRKEFEKYEKKEKKQRFDDFTAELKESLRRRRESLEPEN